MHSTEQIAQHFQQVFFGGNWTTVNVKDTLSGTGWQVATHQLPSFNTIAALTYHIGYYVSAVTDVLKGGPLTAHDRYSFDVPAIPSQEAWDSLVNKTLGNAMVLAELIAQLPDDALPASFTDEKYGTYHRNLLGIIEHTHYHLGQIVVLKKMIEQAG